MHERCPDPAAAEVVADDPGRDPADQQQEQADVHHPDGQARHVEQRADLGRIARRPDAERGQRRRSVREDEGERAEDVQVDPPRVHRGPLPPECRREQDADPRWTRPAPIGRQSATMRVLTASHEPLERWSGGETNRRAVVEPAGVEPVGHRVAQRLIEGDRVRAFRQTAFEQVGPGSAPAGRAGARDVFEAGRELTPGRPTASRTRRGRCSGPCHPPRPQRSASPGAPSRRSASGPGPPCVPHPQKNAMG